MMKFPILRALFDDQCPLLEDEELYERLLDDNEFLVVAPQVYFLLKQNRRMGETPAFFQAGLKKKFSEALVQNFFIKTQSEQVLREFEEQGLNVIPLKGVGFAEKMFGHLAARPTSDIDLLIRLEDLEQAIDCVLACGFAVEEEAIPEHFHCSFSKNLPNSIYPLRVELHWNIVREDTASFNIQEFWAGAIPRASFKHVKELSTYHTFYMIVLHGWRHNLQSLKYYLDIIQMISVMRGELDYSRLLRNAARHRTAKRIIRTLSIVYQEYPFLEEWVPFSFKRKKRFWSKNKYAEYIDYQFLSFDTLGHGVKEFVYWLRHEVLKRKKVGNM